MPYLCIYQIRKENIMTEKEMLRIIKEQGFFVLHHSNDNGITVCDEFFLLVFESIAKAYRFLILYKE